MKIDGLCEVEFFVKRSVQMRTPQRQKNSKLAKGLNLMRNKSSIAEERTSARRKSNAKSKVKRSSKRWTFDYYVSAPDSVRPLQVLPQQTAPERHPRGTHKYILIAASART